MIFYDDLNEIEDVLNDDHLEERVKQMYWFFRGGKDEDESNTNNQKLCMSRIFFWYIHRILPKPIFLLKYDIDRHSYYL